MPKPNQPEQLNPNATSWTPSSPQNIQETLPNEEISELHVQQYLLYTRRAMVVMELQSLQSRFSELMYNVSIIDGEL